MTDNQKIIFQKSFTIEGSNFAAAGSVSKQIKKLLKQLNINGELIWRAMIAAYEAEMNVVLYANECEVLLEVSPGQISMVFKDRGPGIPDIDLAMKEGYSTATREMRERGFGAGLGLPNMKKTADRFNIESIVGQGTTISLGFNLSQ